MQINSKLKEVFPYLIWFFLFCSVAFQLYHYALFMNKGPRFTAYDRTRALRKSEKARDNGAR